MTRTVPEWIGDNDDQQPPKRVRLRVWERCKGRCSLCGRVIRAGETWTLEHLLAIINGGENREANLGLTCENCLPGKNAADVATKSKTAQVKAKHLGIHKPKGRPMPGTKASGWKHKLSGQWERR